MGIAGTTGLIFYFAAVLSAIFLYRTLKYGPYMHGMPYVLCLIGAVLLYLAPDFLDPIKSSLLLTTITAVIHGAVVYDMYKDARKKIAHRSAYQNEKGG